jgi:hypothetical protein
MFCDSVLLKCTGAETKCVEVIGTGMNISLSILVFIFLKYLLRSILAIDNGVTNYAKS